MRGRDYPCARPGCGHPASWHRLDDAKNVSPADPAAQFRCIGYDCEKPGADPAGHDCACPDFVEPAGYRTQLEMETVR